MSQILLVESNGSQRALLAGLLVQRGHVITEAINGHQALETFDSAPRWVHLVILRSNLPGLDGVEVFRALRVRNPTLKILFMKESEDEEIIGLEPGCVVISKPFSSLEFLTAVQRCLG